MKFELHTDRGVLEQITIEPTHSKWSHYVDTVAHYIETHWPEVLDNSSSIEFREQYEKDLRSRLDEGGRYLILWRFNQATLGFANAYISNIGRRKTLNIAEFSVMENMRKSGWGRLLFSALLDVGRSAGANLVVVEVDKPMESNIFWKKVLGSCNTEGERNIYSSPIKPTRLLFIRHGEVEILDEARIRCVNDSLLNITAQAQQRVALLKSQFDRFFSGLGWPLVVSSPLTRCHQTSIGLVGTEERFYTDERLREFFPEELQGRMWSEILAQYGSNIESNLLNGDYAKAFPHSVRPDDAVEGLISLCREVVSAPSFCAERIVISHQMLHALLLLYCAQAPLHRRGAFLLAPLHATAFRFNSDSELPIVEFSNHADPFHVVEEKGL